MSERMKDEFDSEYEYLKSPRCPYCGHSIEDSYDIFAEPGGDGEVEDGADLTYRCDYCKKKYRVTVAVTYDFSTIFPDDLEGKEDE